MCSIHILCSNCLKTPPPKSLITHSLTHIHSNKFFCLKHQDASTLYTTDRLSWRNLAGLAQGLLFYSNKPVMWRDLANLAPEKKFGSTPWRNYAFRCGFSAFIRNFVGWDALAKAKEGPKRKFEGKRESYPTGTWGRNSQSA